MDISEIVKGGDERILLDETGLNKYYVNPLNYEKVFNRGSCTCSPLTTDSKRAIERMINRLDTEPFSDLLAEQQTKLKKHINFPGQDKFDIFYAPSGSDLCYYPILFSRILHPEKDIFNLLTCPEELGSGSNIANNGKYYFSINQFGDKVKKDELIHPDIHIKQQTFPARDTQGNIIDHKQTILKTIDEKLATNNIIANLVIGSKSGIRDNVSIIPEAPKDVFWVVDICQFRASKSLINNLIDLNCMVMITGSKFYQSPPFCGALLVPKTITSQLKNITNEAVAPFKDIFATCDIPSSLPELQNHFKPLENTGTLLRWEAAVSEMNSLSFYTTDIVNNAIDHWNAFIVSQLQFNSEYFDLMPDQHITNRSIISFSVKKPNGELLDDQELRQLFMKICMEEHDDFGKFEKIIIGQPVKYDERSFIRLALGSYNVRKLIANNFDFQYDKMLVRLLIKETKALFWS